MSRQAHILSFDDVKRGNARYSATRSRADRADEGRGFRQRRESSRKASSPLLSYLSEDEFADPYDEGRPSRDRRSGARRRAAAEPDRSRARSRQARESRFEGDRSTAARRRGDRDVANREEDDAFEPSAADRRRAKAKARAKARADRAFDRQYADDAPTEQGPRAAVYKGQMGTSQRRAQRMQEEGASPSRNRRRAGFSVEGLLAAMHTRGFMIGAAVAACLVLSTAFLYPTAQQYYCSVRNHDKLAIEYAALSDRNDALQSDVDALQTDAGVEQRAHEQLGWVKKGEQSANVRGLDLDDSSDGQAVVANINSDSVKAPTTWYSPVLDVLFGYK